MGIDDSSFIFRRLLGAVEQHVWVEAGTGGE